FFIKIVLNMERPGTSEFRANVHARPVPPRRRNGMDSARPAGAHLAGDRWHVSGQWTTGVHRLAPTRDGLPPTRPSPGWWPCTDYPEWLDMVKRVVRRHTPDADIVFWTYNWGYAPEEDRLALIRSLPTDISLNVTFEMFEPIRREGVQE